MRRLIVLGCIVCGVASVAIVGSALAQGGSDTQASQEAPPHAPSTLTPRQRAVGKPLTVKLKIGHSKGQTLAFVPVTVHGKKIFFILDTGAGKTLITSKYAKEFGLEDIGKPEKTTGVGCTTTSQPVKIDEWSIAGMDLPTTKASSSQLALVEGTPVAGLLGSDVWNELGAIKIDYAHAVLTIG